mmetsp:Transcript_62717/g.53201  ORF Transcript_62717/g.53201 Transcript_62717/m.53201 type:complete len:102 (+) Transcript_62717:350-655(+)
MKGFISGTPAVMNVKGNLVSTVEINFLCVHKGLRDKRMAPILIKEVTRRANVRHIFQAIYTIGDVICRPFVYCKYWHRNLNSEKLLSIGFCSMRSFKSKED